MQPWPVSFWPRKGKEVETEEGVHISPNKYVETWPDFLRRVANGWMLSNDRGKLLKLADAIEHRTLDTSV